MDNTKDVFEKAKIELTYDFSVFFFILGILFYGNVIANEIWYHFYAISFGVLAILITPFLLKNYGLRTAANWFVIQQTITSTASVCIQEFIPDMSGPIWTLSFILFTIFIFGVKDGMLRLIPFLSIFVLTVILATNNIRVDFGIDESEQLPNAPFVTIIPFLLCLYLIIVFVKTNTAAQKQIHEQNNEIEHSKKEITDSINYAKRIQKAVLPSDEIILKNLPGSFILFKPKDIVSGDFYWFHEIDSDQCIIVCGDCTGHGVPGAFMTVVGCNLLNNIVIENKIHQPSEILNTLDKHITFTLKQHQEASHYVPDGMDLSLVKINKKENSLIFCSAKRPAFYFQNGNLTELKGTKFSLGGMRTEEKSFNEININTQKGDQLFLYTDGYVDQFGGPNNKKFMTKKFKETLNAIIKLPVKDQKEMLEKTISDWKILKTSLGKIHEYEQTDDIQVIGIHF